MKKIHGLVNNAELDKEKNSIILMMKNLITF